MDLSHTSKSNLYLNLYYTFYFKICVNVSWLDKGWLSFVSWGVTIKSLYETSCELWKDNKDEFISLNVNVYNLWYHSYPKTYYKLSIYGWRMAPPTTSIRLCTVWLIVNVKISYLQYEVVDDKFCVRAVTVIYAIISEVYLFCCYFGLYEQHNDKLNTYLKNNCRGMLCLTIFSLSLSSYLLLFFVTMSFCVTTWIYQFDFTKFLFLWYFHLTFCVMVYSSILGVLQKKSLFNRQIPTNFLTL